MNVTALAELQRWYDAHCDGDWEHTYGVKIETLDNPGWNIVIDLAFTDLEDVPLVEVQHNEIAQSFQDNPEWFVCRKIESKFEGSGGPNQLEAILRVFLNWVHSQSEPTPPQAATLPKREGEEI